MKKNIIKIGILSFLTFGFISTINSCRDAIDIEQDGIITDKVLFSSVGNLQKYLYGDVYQNVDTATEIFATSILTDEVRVGSSNGNNNITSYRLSIDASNGFANDIWLNNYLVINRVARLLRGAKNITPTSPEETNKYNKILAEARAMRALAYLNLETYFSENMADDNALGVIIVDEVPTPNTRIPRNKNAEVYKVIEDDLTFAEQYLPQSSRYLASKNLVNAIRARLNLYRGKYAEAKTYAEKVISDSGLSLGTTAITNASQVAHTTKPKKPVATGDKTVATCGGR